LDAWKATPFEQKVGTPATSVDEKVQAELMFFICPLVHRLKTRTWQTGRQRDEQNQHCGLVKRHVDAAKK